MRLGEGQGMQRENDNTHTHSQVKPQSGAEIPAIAMPGKDKDPTSSAASNIWNPVVLQAVGKEPRRGQRWRSKVSTASGWLVM